uniref:Reverse transcriptase RNase H-like domain-containing protein n=1 Tax=Amphimedon queenslandica TaxID=400682 RepID=A0A1X7V418_AMPQE
TDHRALQWLHKFKEKNARLTRWSLILQPYNFTIQHRKGVANANADALSRLERKSTSCQRGREEIPKVEAIVYCTYDMASSNLPF